MKNFIMILFLMLSVNACPGVQKIPDAPKALASYDAPDWVLKGSGAYSDEKGKAFFGVGSATGIKNFSLQRTVADDRARNDLAKVFQFYVSSLTKDYQGHTTAGSFKNSSEEQNAEVAMKVGVAQTMRVLRLLSILKFQKGKNFFL